jgi:hypothetical protein
MTLVALNRIFKTKYGGAFSKMPDYSVGNTPVIKSQGANNGVIGYLDIKPNFHNIITIARTGSVGATFFHPYPCYATDDCIVLEAKIKLTERQMLFYAYLIRKESKRYNYSRKVTPNRLNSTLIFSPGDIPNWVNNTPNLDMPPNSSITEADISINQRTWKEFIIGDLFTCSIAKSYDFGNINNTTIPNKTIRFIGRTQFNNGLTSHIEYKNDFIVQSANTISIAMVGVSGVSFYQSNAYICSQNILVLENNNVINPYIAMFLTTVFNLERFRFSYGRTLQKNYWKQHTIKLPSINGNPDWQFMEDYIKSLPYSSNL